MAGGEDVTQQGAPHGITLLDHAQIAAEIAEGDRPTAEVLHARGLTEAQWNESTIYWMTRLGDDVREHGQDARIPHVYSDAFSKAQDAIKPVPSMDAASYAQLVVDIQLAGGPAQPLAARGLSTADYSRVTDQLRVQAYYELSAKVGLNAGASYAHRDLVRTINDPAVPADATGSDRTKLMSVGGRWAPRRYALLGCDVSSEKRKATGSSLLSADMSAKSLTCYGQFTLQ